MSSFKACAFPGCWWWGDFRVQICDLLPSETATLVWDREGIVCIAILSPRVDYEMLICFLRKSLPLSQLRGLRAAGAMRAEWPPNSQVKVAKEPRCHFLECIYPHLFLDIKIGLSWRQMTESFEDSYCLSFSTSVLCVTCCLTLNGKNGHFSLWSLLLGAWMLCVGHRYCAFP